MTRFAGCAPHHKPLPLSVPELLMSEPAGAAAPHHHRRHIPRIIWPPSQVFPRTGACTCRESTTQWRHLAARSEHRHPHPPPPDLRGPCLCEPHERCLRGRVAGASLPVLLHRLLICLRFLVYQCVCAPAPVAPRALAELRSGCLRCPGPRWPLSKLFGLQRRQQRRYAERSNARDPPTEPACRPTSALSALPVGDSLVPCWCWQVQETPPSHAA